MKVEGEIASSPSGICLTSDILPLTLFPGKCPPVPVFAAAKTGTGGHLPGNKVKGKISEVRQIPEGEDAISPSTFKDLTTVDDFLKFSNRVRELTGGIPIGFKLSAQHIEDDIEFAVSASADYIILDGRGGGTGAAPLIFRDNISVPTIPALARARNYLDKKGYDHVSLIVTGGLRTSAEVLNPPVTINDTWS